MSKKSLALARAKAAFDALISCPEQFPVTFCYNEKEYHGFGGLTVIEKTITPTDDGTDFLMKFALDENAAVSVFGRYCAEFGEYEYTLAFENIGSGMSGVIRDVYCLDACFDGADGVLRGILGDHVNYYKAYETPLADGEIYQKSDIGRATHIVFPYFDLVHGDGGTLLAIGWAGTWDARFSERDGAVSVCARTCLGLETVLLPGERIRSGLVVILPYAGRDAFGATNLWREWFMKYNLPRANAKGDRLEPFTTMGFMNDTGLPNSDGSISERSYTWRPSLEKMLEKDIHPDFRWFDAGWYLDPYGKTVPSDWWGTIGTWTIDTEKWPDGSFRESVDVMHEKGIKTLVWFEPERVTHVEALAENYGYNPAWGLSTGKVITNNIGDDACLDWTFGQIVKMMRENDIDLYREDNNSDPAGSWKIVDAAENARCGAPRNGIGENRAIVGHYRLWDRILAFCGETGKCTFLDSCASGGGRNDIESMRRGVPFLRSDFDRSTTAIRLSQTASFCKWIPFHGSATKETLGQLESEAGRGASPYAARASLLPIMNYNMQFVQNPEIDYALFHRNLAEWESVKHLLTKDLYVLTPWHHHEDKTGWTALAYDDPAIGESLLLGFRMEDCEEETYTAKLPFAEAGQRYTLTDADTGKTQTDADTGKTQTLDGGALAAGVVLTAKEKKTSILIRITRE